MNVMDRLNDAWARLQAVDLVGYDASAPIWIDADWQFCIGPVVAPGQLLGTVAEFRAWRATEEARPAEAWHPGYAALAQLLIMIQRYDQEYAVRNDLVLAALAQARAIGLRAGVRIDPNAPAWPVAFLELPSGQVSWHLPEHPVLWDGHTTAEKYARVAAFVWRYPPLPPSTGGKDPQEA